MGIFKQMYKIFAVLPQELAAEVYRFSKENNDADDIFGSENAPHGDLRSQA